MKYKALVKVPIGASNEERQLAIRQGIEDLLSELVGELGFDPDDALELCESAIETAVEEQA